MNRHVSRSCTAIALAGALFSAQAGAMTSSAQSSAAGSGWAYVPSRFVSPEEADAINASAVVEDDQSPVTIYVASFVSPPDYSLMSTE
jgi:hypothetical protein